MKSLPWPLIVVMILLGAIVCAGFGMWLAGSISGDGDPLSFAGSIIGSAIGAFFSIAGAFALIEVQSRRDRQAIIDEMEITAARDRSDARLMLLDSLDVVERALSEIIAQPEREIINAEEIASIIAPLSVLCEHIQGEREVLFDVNVLAKGAARKELHLVRRYLQLMEPTTALFIGSEILELHDSNLLKIRTKRLRSYAPDVLNAIKAAKAALND